VSASLAPDRAKPRRSLLRNYFTALFAAVVLPLLLNGASEAWFGYRDRRAMLERLMRTEAGAAAAKIEAFIGGIKDQLGWAVQQSWTAGTEEQHRLAALGLLRQVPAIIELGLVDGEGKERIFVSRLGLNRTDALTDRSAEAPVAGAREAKLWYGPVTFYLNSEPYMTVAVAGNRKSAGVAVAQVNLKLIWEVVSAIRVGDTGRALIIDRPGQLIAHPDIDRVLRGTDAATAKAMTDLRDRIVAEGGAPVAVDAPEGAPMIAAMAGVPGVDWTVLVEQPLSEAYAPIYAAIRRTALLLGAGALFAAGLAYWLAHRMTGPIKLLQQGAEQIGTGHLEHRIDIRTGDELEQLAGGFNQMAAGLAESRERSERIAKLKRFLAPQVAELVDSRGSEALLAGQRREIVAVFCDLRGFTAFSAKSAPDEIMSVLGDYHETLGTVVMRHGATITSYMGDGVMVLVNAPVQNPDPGFVATQMAIEIQREMRSHIARWKKQGHSLGLGIGLAMGEATVGRIGHESRLDYAAIGPAVNLAARLCAEAADGQILADPAVAAKVEGRIALTALGARALKGLTEDLVVHMIMDDRNLPLSAH
jgi:class 3 adenylate cyclase